MVERGLLIVISGPSGVGKGTVAAALMKKRPDICFSVSATTREMRAGEQEGVSYFFKTEDEFKGMIQRNEFLEYMQVFGKNYYGTPRRYVEDKLNGGMSVLLDIDVRGAMQVKQNAAEAITIFIAPPSLRVLKRRLIGRNTETPEAIERRLAECKTELSYIPKYNYVVVNDDIDAAVSSIEAILCAARHTPQRYDNLLKNLLAEPVSI